MPGIERVSDEIASRLLDYWQRRRGDRRFPSRADMEPAGFSYAAGRVSMVECNAEAPRYRYLLASTSLTQQLGYEMTGRSTEEIPEADLRAYVERLYGAVCESGEPFHETGERVLDGRSWIYAVLVLPLSDDGARVDALLIYREARASRGYA